MRILQVFIENLDKQRIPFKKKILLEAVLYLLGLLKIKKAQINIYFVNNARIRKINQIYLKKNYPTDVISFNLSENGDNILVEVFISLQMAKHNALVYKGSLAGEVMLYIIHAILHILGFDHRCREGKKTMFKKQSNLLRKVSSYIYSRYKIKID